MQFLLFIYCLLRYIFGAFIIESMIVNMIKIIEANCQIALKNGQISLKNMRVFSSMADFKIHVTNFSFYIILFPRPK